MSANLEPWLEKVKRWTAPISEAAPSGTPAREDSRYESLAQEISKLDSPAAPPVVWSAVVEIAGAILAERSKDILIASYLAFGLSRTRGLEGLTSGMVLLSAVMERYWDSLYPEIKRIRGRAAALAWYLGKVVNALPGTPVTPADRALLKDLEAAARQLAQLSRDKLESNAPSFGQVIEQIQRLQLALPPEQPAAPPPAAPAAPQPAAPAAPAAAPPPPAAAPAVAPPPAPVAAPAVSLAPVQLAAFTAGADTVRFLLPVGKTLIETATALRKASNADPTAYRLLRQGMWMHMCDAPPIDPSGKTRERPLPQDLRAQCDRMLSQGAWAQLIETAETVLANCRLLLDPHRYVALALAGLGATHEAARQTVLAELGAFLRRFPALVEASASDGNPLADSMTKTWLESEVLAGSGGGKGAKGSKGEDDSPEEKAAREGRELAGAGKMPEAIALLGRAAKGTGDGQARFRLRLQIAELCSQQGELHVARGLFEALDREAQERKLADWEPTLAVAALQGFLMTVRKLGAASKGAVEPGVAPMLYDRLSLLDPSAALRLGGKPQG